MNEAFIRSRPKPQSGNVARLKRWHRGSAIAFATEAIRILLPELFVTSSLKTGIWKAKNANHALASPCAAGPSGDPLKRFRATCLRYDALLMGRHVRVETDSSLVSRRIAEALVPEPAQNGHPQFVWRIACESREGSSRMWPSMSAFCHGSLRYISLGQYSFIAADLRAREAIGVLPEALCEDDIGFSTVFLSSLLHLTAPALGLIPVSAACVAKAQNGLLLFGPPNSGKTTAAYCGKKLGLEFHSDQASFLEFDAGAVHAWGLLARGVPPGDNEIPSGNHDSGETVPISRSRLLMRG